MVHRRMTHDDGRGVGQALNEPGVDGKGLIIRGRHWVTAAPAAAAPASYKHLLLRGLSLPTTVAAFAQLGALTPAQWLAANTGRRSLLAAPLPQNVHLATVQAKSASRALLRLAHLFSAGESATLSQNATVSLAGLFAGKTVASAVEMTLPGSQPLAGVPQRTYVTDGGAKVTVPILPPPPSGAGMDVVLGPMEIRTFEVTFA